MSKLKKALHSVVYNCFGKAVASVFTFLSFIFIVRALNVADYGQYAFYLNAVFFFTLLFDFGGAEIVLRFIPEYLENKQPKKIIWLVNKTIALVSMAGVGTAALVFLAVRFSPGALGQYPFARLLALMALFGWFRILTLVLGNVLNAFYYQTYRISIELLYSGLRCLLVFLLIQKGIDAWGIVVLYAFLDILLAAAYWLRIKRYINSAGNAQENDLPQRLISFGLHEYLYRLFWFFTDNRFDIYLAGILVGMTQAGHLAFAASIVNLLIDWSPGFIMRPAISPLFIREYTANKDIAQVQYLFKLHNKFIVFVSLPIFLLLAIFADKLIIYVFEPKYLPAVPVFLLLIFATFFINLIIPLRNIISILEKPAISNISNIAAIPKIILILLCAKYAGVMGIAIAYTLSLFFILWINTALLNRAIRLSYPWKSFGKIVINCAVMAMSLFFLRVAVTSRMALLLASVLGMLVYLAASRFNRAFEQRDRDLFNRALKAPLWQF